MNTFKQCALALNLTPEELVKKIIHRKFTRDKQTEAMMARSIVGKYDDYGILPQYVEQFCERIMCPKSGIIIIPRG